MSSLINTGNSVADAQMKSMKVIIGGIMDAFDRASGYRSKQTDRVARIVEDLGNAKGIIAKWGAQRRESEGDVGLAIEQIHHINLLSAFMIVADQKMTSSEFLKIYFEAKELLETGFKSAAVEMLNAMDDLDWEREHSKEVV
jgi:hypothetical protein